MRLVPNKAKYALARWIGDVIEKRAKRILRETNVWEPLQAYLAESPSTGCSYSDYLLLYKYIREKKPKHVLECGTGVSTVVTFLKHMYLQLKTSPGCQKSGRDISTTIENSKLRSNNYQSIIFLKYN